MSEDGVVDVPDARPPTGTHTKQDEFNLQSTVPFISHVLKFGDGLVKELRFSTRDRKCNVTDYMIERLQKADVIAIAENLMKARVEYLSDISNSYKNLQDNIGYEFALSFIRSLISENFEWIEWEYENFSSANEWAKPRQRNWRDTENLKYVHAKIYDVVDKFGDKDWLFAHRLFSQEAMGWWEGHIRVYRQRLILGKAVEEPKNWNYEQYEEEKKKEIEPITIVEENKPSPKELICSFLGYTDKWQTFQEVRIRYTNDMVDFEVPDIEALTDKVIALIHDRLLKSNHPCLWDVVLLSLNSNIVKYLYALFKKGDAALERFEDENTHKDNLAWNQPRGVQHFLQFFNKAIHYETTTPVPMTERRNPLVVQSGLDFMNKFISGSLNPGSDSGEPSFSSRPLTEADIYPSETHAADGGQKTDAVNKESQPTSESSSKAESQSETESPPDKLSLSETESKPKVHNQPEAQCEPKNTSVGTKEGSSQSMETSGKIDSKRNMAGTSETKDSQIEVAPPVAEPVSVPALTRSSAPLLTSPVVVTLPISAAEVTKEETVIKKTGKVEPVMVTAKPALSYAKVVKKTNGDSEDSEKKLRASEPAIAKRDSGTNEAQIGRQNEEDDDGSEWTKVVSKSNDNRLQKKQKNKKNGLQHSDASAISHKKVLRSLDSKDTDESSSTSSSSTDIKSQNGNTKYSGNGKHFPLDSKDINTLTSDEGSQKSNSGNSSESEKPIKNAWGQPPGAEKKDVEPNPPFQPEEQESPKLTKTAIKKAKKAAAAAAAAATGARAASIRVPNVKRLFSDTEIIEPVSNTNEEASKTEKLVTPTQVPNVKRLFSDPEPKVAEPARNIQKLVMVADDHSEAEAVFEVKIKEPKPSTSTNNNKKKTSKKGAGNNRQAKKLTIVEAQISDKTATMVLEKALQGVLKKEGLSPDTSEQNQDSKKLSTTSNIPQAARNRQENGNRSDEYPQPQVVHDYRPGVRPDNGEPAPRGGRVEPAVANNAPVHDEDFDDELNDELDLEQEAALANPENPIQELAGCATAHDMFVEMKYFSDYRNQLAKEHARFRKKMFITRAERFQLVYLFRLRIAKGMAHILNADTQVEAVTTREDATTRLLVAFLQEPLENKDSLRGQNLDNIEHFKDENQETLAAFRYLDLRLAELGQENEIRMRYQQICDRLLTVMRGQNGFYRLLAPYCPFKRQKHPVSN